MVRRDMNRNSFTHILNIFNDTQAQLLGAYLAEKDIPHVIVSNHDTVYAGIFQPQLGWGYLSAPEEHREEILRIWEDVQRPEDGEFLPE